MGDVCHGSVGHVGHRSVTRRNVILKHHLLIIEDDVRIPDLLNWHANIFDIAIM